MRGWKTHLDQLRSSHDMDLFRCGLFM
jgi:hypothetical protein